MTAVPAEDRDAGEPRPPTPLTWRKVGEPDPAADVAEPDAGPVAAEPVAAPSPDAAAAQPGSSADRMPRWVARAIVLFWVGAAVFLVGRFLVGRLDSLLLMLVISLFLALAIEPGVNLLARRGWRRGVATGVLLLGVLVVALVIVGAVGSVVGSQVADLLGDSDRYVDRTVTFVNDNFGTNIDAAEVKDAISDPDGPVQRFIRSQSDEALRLSARVGAVLLQALSVALFTFYMVADGPKLRRALCSRLPPDRQRRVLEGWDIAIEKTGGYLYSRAILALLSAIFHYIAFSLLGVPSALAMAIWVGIVSQFLPVVGTYLAGVLPVLVTLIDNPSTALWVLGVIVLYQQLENYVLQPRVSARTMELHPAVAFGAAIAGAAILGPIGALLALPAAATLQAFFAQWGERHEVIETHLTEPPHRRRRWG